MPKLNKLQVQELLELYKSAKMDSGELAKKFNITPPSVIGFLKRNGIERKRRNYGKKYKYSDLKHDYFSNINTESAAYYAGFIAADGSIYRHPTKPMQKRLTIEIHKKDRDILEKFDIGTDIFERKNRNMVTKAISSDKICDDLAKVGITQNKTFRLVFPEVIDDNNIHHFIRGYFDGDGWFTISKKGHLRSGFVGGSIVFLEELQKRIPCKSSIRIPKGKSYGILSMYQESTIEFAKFIYKDSTFLLKRKKAIIDQFNESL